MKRTPKHVDKALKSWLWREEQRWRRAAIKSAAAEIVRVELRNDWDKEPGLSPSERATAKKVAAAMNAGADKILITRASAKKAREMLGLDWREVADYSGLLPSVIMAMEGRGPWTVPQAKILQAVYEHEGLRFTPEGGVERA